MKGDIMNNTNFTNPLLYNNNNDLNEQSYVENILRLNRGKSVEIYTSYADANAWKDKVFKGIIEQSGKDHIILSDPNTGEWYLILLIYVDFIRFMEKINTSPSFYPNN